MSALSSKLRLVEDNRIAFRCPGCKYLHVIGVGEGTGERWRWNNDVNKPTFQPSILVRTTRHDLTDEEWKVYDIVVAKPGGTEAVLTDPRFRYICHSYVTDGRIQFLSDCTHELAGQTVELPDSN